MLQNLIRFDTTNSPGNEATCIAYAREKLAGAGFETAIRTHDEVRPNLVTRLPVRGDAAPLLMFGPSS
jgi:acetylornithine deacetylase/succinyl-diaminopimelate desuccinylase-like protein